MIYLLEFFRVQLSVSVLLGLVFVPKVCTLLAEVFLPNVRAARGNRTTKISKGRMWKSAVRN